MTPLYFGSPQMPLFGWLHLPEPATATPSLAVLLCAPLGHEDLAAHGGQRRLASALAAAGLPTLRFDYAGCGDSADPASALDAESDVTSDAPQVWLQSIHDAADALLTRSGATTLALVGVRMGALLAAHAAVTRDDVAALVGVLPVASGRAWLRECRMLGGAAAMAADSSGQAGNPSGATDIGGLLLDAAAAKAVSALRWPAPGSADTSGAPRPALRALLIERDDLDAPGDDGPAAQALRGLGSELRCERLAGLDLLTTVAHSAHTPPVLIERLTGWLGEVAATADAAGVAATLRLRGDGMPSDTRGGWHEAPPVRVAVGTDVVEERIVSIGAAPRLVGVLTSPADGPRAQDAVPRRGVLLLSSGAERRVGPNRLWVAFARRRAAAGDVVLRLDLAGLGDSDERPGTVDGGVGGAVGGGVGGPTNAVYDTRCVDDIATALAWLRREHAVQRCDVLGVCSGAYHAWRAALQGADVSSVVVINPLVFHWRPGMSLDPQAHAFGQLAVAVDAARAARDPARWLKLLRGQVNVRVIARALFARCRATPLRLARGGLRLLGVALRDDLASELRSVARRGVALHFVFAADEPGLWLLRQGAAGTLARLQRDGRVRVQQVETADHTFTQHHAREALYERLHRALDMAATPAETGRHASARASQALSVPHG